MQPKGLWYWASIYFASREKGPSYSIARRCKRVMWQYMTILSKLRFHPQPTSIMRPTFIWISLLCLSEENLKWNNDLSKDFVSYIYPRACESIIQHCFGEIPLNTVAIIIVVRRTQFVRLVVMSGSIAERGQQGKVNRQKENAAFCGELGVRRYRNLIFFSYCSCAEFKCGK